MLEEWNQRRGHGHELLWRYVHVINLLGFNIDKVALRPAGDRLRKEVALVIERRIGLRNDERLFTIGREIIKVTGDAALLHATIRRFEKPEIIHARERRERGDETDVLTFRRFDRTDASIVRRMHVANFEACAIAGKTARPESRQASLVR